MTKTIATAAATAALALSALAPALAGETAYQLAFVDPAAAKNIVTDAKMLPGDAVEIPAPENFYERDGHAQIEIHLDETGVVSDVTLKKTCGYYRIDQNALKLVRAAKYTPAINGSGKSVAGYYFVDINLETTN